VLLRVPTWSPFRLQIYFNQHQWLARQLRREGIGFELRDNAFVELDDWKRTQQIADGFNLAALHRKLSALARRFCPIVKRFPKGYHFSLMQVQSDFHTRVEGTRIKHSLNRQAIKNVDKQKRVLRVECTTNEVTFYRHHCQS